VPAARAGECLLILFPRTGTGTVFILGKGVRGFIPIPRLLDSERRTFADVGIGR